MFEKGGTNMAEWSSAQYLKFKSQRTQPAIDLAERIRRFEPKTVLDLGCGPGNSTRVLKNIFPTAHILGIDSSENMLKTARESNPDMEFACFDGAEIDKIGRSFDVVFSNACLQWIPHHETLLAKIFSVLNKGGVLAVQIPMNGGSPFFKSIDSIVSQPKWGFDKVAIDKNSILSPEEYHGILCGLTDSFDIWETVYYHCMPDCNAIVEWVKGTRLLPYLNALDKGGKKAFLDEVLKSAESIFQVQKNGEVIFKFKRLFFTAEKK